MIATLLTGIATSPWMRAALRYAAIVLAVLLFLLSLRRSGERAGRLPKSATRLWYGNCGPVRTPISANLVALSRYCGETRVVN